MNVVDASLSDVAQNTSSNVTRTIINTALALPGRLSAWLCKSTRCCRSSATASRSAWRTVTGTGWTFTDTTGPLVDEYNYAYTAKVQDNNGAGNFGPVSNTCAITIDTAAPTAAVAITAIATDSGTSSSDYITRHDADGVGHARPARLRREGAGQQRRRRQLGRCHHQHGSTWSYTDPDAARHELHLPGADRRRRGQCRCQHRQPGGDHRHGGADGAVDHLDRRRRRRRHQRRRGLERHAGGGRLAGTGAAAGDTLTVNWGGQTVTYTLLAADISASSATVTVPLRRSRRRARARST